MAAMVKKLTTDNRNNEHDIPNHRVQGVEEKGERRRSCEEIREEPTREIGNHIGTRNTSILHKAPLQVYKELPPTVCS
jgi:hypothetical protein